MTPKYGPYKFDEIVQSLSTVIAEVWEPWEAAAFPWPWGVPDQAAKRFEALRVLKYLVNRTVAAKNEHDFFGHCPYCGGNDGYFNIERDHYFYCQLCQCMWLRGSNLFGSWRSEDSEIWNQNASRFNAYELVEPVLDWSAKNREVQT